MTFELLQWNHDCATVCPRVTHIQSSLQTSTECCLEFTGAPQLSNVSWAGWSAHPYPQRRVDKPCENLGCLGENRSGLSPPPADTSDTQEPPDGLESVSDVSSISVSPNSSQISVTAFASTRVAPLWLPARLLAHFPPPRRAMGPTVLTHCPPAAATCPKGVSIGEYAPAAPGTPPTCADSIFHNFPLIPLILPCRI